MTKRYEALQVRSPASETAADLPADPFTRRPRLSGLGGYRLSGRPAVLVLASLIVALLASSAAPTPRYSPRVGIIRAGCRGC